MTNDDPDDRGPECPHAARSIDDVLRGSIARYEADYADHDKLLGKTADDLPMFPEHALHAKHAVKGEGKWVAGLRRRVPLWRRLLRWVKGVRP